MGLVEIDMVTRGGAALPGWLPVAWRSWLMNLSCDAGRTIRRGWSLTQTDVLFCSLPIVFFLSIVSFV